MTATTFSTASLGRTTAGRAAVTTSHDSARPSLLTVLGEAVSAARAVGTADARTSVAVAARFAARV